MAGWKDNTGSAGGAGTTRKTRYVTRARESVRRRRGIVCLRCVHRGAAAAGPPTAVSCAACWERQPSSAPSHGRCTDSLPGGEPCPLEYGMQAFWLRLTPPLAVPGLTEIVVTGPATRARATLDL